MTQWFLTHVIQPVLQWLQDMVTWSLLKVFKLVTVGLLTVFNAIPVPSFISSASGYASNISPSVAWIMGSFQVSFGFGVVLSAYLIRFLIRRLPFIG